MKTRKFAPLFWTQFLSAFNDNFLKQTLIFLILATMAAEGAALITLAGGIFIVPFLALSALGGELADKHDKAHMAERLKLTEIGIAAISVIGIAFSSIFVMMVALFGFGVISALFGPIKYGILPDLLETKDLPKANAWIEGGTFIAILTGTIVAALAFAEGDSVWIFGPMMMVLSVLCWLFARIIPRTGAQAPSLVVDKNVLRSSMTLVKELREDTRVWRSALMNCWFWFVGAFVMSMLPIMVSEILGGSELVVPAYLAIFAISIAIGSAIAGWMSAGRVVLLPAPIGTAIVALFGLDLAWNLWGLQSVTHARTISEFFAGQNTIRVAIDLAGMAVGGAFLAVPTFSAMQTWADEKRRARVIGGANVLSALFITIGLALVAILQAVGVSVPMIILGLSIINIAVAWLMLKTLPTNPFRDFISILFRAFMRLEVEGLENIRKAGRAPIIALNHVSFLDGALALAITEEEPVFAVDYKIAQAWWVRPFLKMARFLPLDPTKPMGTRSLIKVAQDGNAIGIFPEGRLTVTGTLMKVYDGAAMVADKTGSMIVPVRIDGLEKSYFSRLSGGQVRRRLFPKVKVTILEPVRLEVPEELKGRKRRIAAGAALYKIMSMLLFETTNTNLTVLERIIETAREKGRGKLAVEDPISGPLSYGKLLTGAAVLGAKFKAMFPKDKTLGVMLPNANGTAATVLGVMSAGKVPAMLNFTAGAANILSACKAAQVKHVLCSHAFVTQGKLGPIVAEMEKEVTFVWLDDLRETITAFDKVLGLFRGYKPLVRQTAEDTAVILFTSGSEGLPKGVVLTHRNILSNAAQAASRIDFHSGDKVFNILPVFHSFGLTAGTVLPLVSGVPVYFYPSPLHYRIVPELIYTSNATIIFGTDTFLNGYARTAHPYDFRSIRYIFSGAEPVKSSTRETYTEKFGLRILEGYGVTETAPVISLNTPMFNRSGTVGKIMPGMEWKLEAVSGIDEGGRLFIKGANVMAGYLRAENPGVIEPLVDGWHDTGDIVTIDEDGFVTIRGRAKRFAKIGGEMVSLATVEAVAAQLWPGNLSVVSSVPDAKKGERLILLTDAQNANRTDFANFAKAKGAMDMMVPAAVSVGEVPVLGSGKVDFIAARKLALAMHPSLDAA
ncbi:acyl-[acyl-carrier-protein]-phospholipid O-acyltransferase/long-chain-fatty-acid--[acyl-carrier-protein] ligase [Rhizobium halophytocola]|uniref:Acyl-[acyl-carrier-protein]-phospholipid O-acyltransferase/long-chain-fatty-acid--[acyl-carrier-protein] ligase n=2 Tax=Rhizobium halophytocola TaxID=735519 RepID=A0ABS4E6L8_9HYPH|nr:acyl-[acyl-carrier-protein]-phospholipid O-acyltransferase/long-chain-fatty-acid--[acyl-carrier-protein] ligase [Rhizobium halophytocola]